MTIASIQPMAMAWMQRRWKTPQVSSSIHRNPGEFDHLAPFLGLIRHQLAEFRRRHRHWQAPRLGKARHQLGVLQGLADGLVEEVDSLRRRALRRRDDVEADGRKSRHGL